MRVAVVTVSDRASAGVYADASGDEIERTLRERLAVVEVSRHLVPDDRALIQEALRGALEAGADVVLTTGGTGLGPRDVTPEATRELCDREVPGIAEAIRMESLRETARAMLSRGYAGMRGKALIVNFPGSPRAVASCLAVLLPVMEHAVAMARGGGHEGRRDAG